MAKYWIALVIAALFFGGVHMAARWLDDMKADAVELDRVQADNSTFHETLTIKEKQDEIRNAPGRIDHYSDRMQQRTF